MYFVISPFIPFPAIAWWAHTVQADKVVFDKAEHFVKMSYRNKYVIAGAEGEIRLSIPLMQGRNQRTAMEDIKISESEQWQTRHWRTLTAAYSRSPFFEHYMPSLQTLYSKQFIFLIDFNLAAIQWIKDHTGISFEEGFTETYQTEYPAAQGDLRIKNQKMDLPISSPEYYQVFKERVGFLPGLSILDLLFSEGPFCKKWIMDNIARLIV